MFYLFLLFLSIVATAGEPRRNIRIGFFQFDGYHQNNAQGVPASGYGYDLLQLMRSYTAWKFEYIGYNAGWSAMLPMLERGEIDLVSSVTKTPERMEKFDFSDHPIGYSGVLMTVKAGNSRYKIRDYANWNGIRIGMIPGNSKNVRFAAFAKEKNFSYREIPISGADELTKALQEGRIDAAVSGSLRRLQDEWIYEQLDFKPFYFAVKKGNSRLLQEINAAVKRLEIEHPGFADVLLNKYYTDNRHEHAGIYFSVEEQDFLLNTEKRKQTFSVLVNPDQIPFSALENGKFHGVMADVLERLKERTGLRLEILPVGNLEDYYRELRTGKADLILDLRYDFAHAEHLGYLLTEPYVSASISILKRKDFSGTAKRRGVIKGSNTEESLRRNMPEGIELVLYPSLKEMVEALKNGGCDGCYIFTRTAENIILNDRTGAFALATAGRVTAFSVGVSEKCDPLLYSVVRKAVLSISAEEIRRILLAHNSSGVLEKTFREFLAEHSLAAFLAACGIFLLLSGALTLALLSRVKVKRAHAELARNTRMWKILMDSIPIHVFAKDLNDKNRYVFCNKALCDFFELPESEILGKSNFELFGIDDADKVQAMDLNVLQSWETEAEQTADVTDKHGRKRSYRLIKRRFEEKDGSRMMLGTATEITELEAERKRARENAEWFRRTLNSIGDGIITTDARGKVLMMNPVAERMTGVTTAEAVGKPHEEVFHIVSSGNEQPVPSPVTRTIRTGNIVELANHTDLVSASGIRYHIADSSAPIRGHDGEITGAILVFRDVTEEYLRRDQLKQALNGLEYAAGLSSAAYFRMEVKSRKLISCSREFPSLWPVRDGIVIPVDEFVLPEDRAENQKIFEDLLKRKIDTAVLDYRAERNGVLRNYQIRATLDMENKSNPELVGVIQDVSDLKQKERKLSDTLKLWNLVMDTIPVMIFIKEVDNDFRYLISNRSFERFMGRSREEIIGKSDRELFASGEMFEHFRKKDESIAKKNLPEEFQESPFDAAGRQLHLRTTKIPFTSADGTRLLLGVSVDMTEETRNRTALEKLQAEQADLLEQHEFLLKAMPFYVFIQDADNDFRYVYCNEACAESLGRSVEEVLGRNNHELFSKKESADHSLDLSRKAMAEGGMREDLQIYIAPDGTRHVGRAFRRGMTLADGRRWLLGMVADITELSELSQNQKTLNDCFSAMLVQEKENAVNEIVRQICGRLEADRGYLIRFDRESGKFVPVSEFLGMSGEWKPVNAQPFEPNDKLYRYLNTEEIVCAPDVDDPEAIEKFGLWKEENTRIGVKSLYCALVRANGTPWGYVGVTYERMHHQISAREREFLISGAHLTGLMLERRYYTEQQAATIEQLRNHKFLMEYGAELTRSGVFRFNPETREVHGSGGLENLLPLRNGKIIDSEDWILAEDMPEVRRQLASLYKDEVRQVTFTFRSDYFGTRRHYRILFSPDGNAKARVWFGAIQDITEITRQTEKLRETMELWNTVLGLIPVMIFAKRADDHFRYTLANKAFENFTGKPQEEIIGHTDAEIFNRPRDLAWFEEYDGAVMRAGEARTTTEDVVGADGMPHTFRTTKVPFSDADGRRLLLASSADVTELKSLIANQNVLNSCLEIFFRADDSAEAIRLVLKNIAGHMNANYVYVLKIDLSRAVVDTVMEYGEPKILSGLKNHPFETSDESLGMLRRGEDCFLTDLHDPAQREILHSWSTFIDKFDMRSIYFSGIRQNGKLWGDLGIVYTEEPYRITELTKQFLRSAAHLIEMLLERKRTADRLRSALEHAQAADRAKSLFLASMSHEIRTPLNAVIGFSELLKDGTLPPEEQKEYLGAIYSAGNSLLALINDVLDLSKLEAGQMEFSCAPVSFSELLLEVGGIFKQKCAERGLWLRYELPYDGEILWLDKLRVRQILFNLIGNAVKFTSHGGITVKAAFARETPERGTLVFHIIDTGCGISMKDRSRIFQIFVQATVLRGTQAASGGTGLGLAICKRLTEQMDGSIGLESEPGKGTDFSVTLRNIRYRVAEKSRERKEESVVLTPSADEVRNILLVDDVPMNLKVMAAMLKRLGMRSEAVGSAKEALAKLREEEFDFILTDMWMPEMNGAELVSAIRKGSFQPEIPVFAVTADIEAKSNFKLDSFSGVLLKPVTVEKLTKLLADFSAGKKTE